MRNSLILLSVIMLCASMCFAQEYALDSNTVALYHFNETSGSDANDESANANNGVVSGTTIVDGRFGKARSYDGIGDYVNLPESGSLSGFTTGITIEAWIYSSSYSSASVIASGNQNDYAIAVYSTGQIRVDLYGVDDISGGAFLSQGSISTNAWHHIAATYDGATEKIFIDGEEDTARSASGSLGTSAQAEDIAIGSYRGGGPNYFSGIIDEVRISNIARQAFEFNVPEVFGLIAYFPFNGNSDDESGHNSNGTIVGGVTAAQDRFNQPNKAFSFDGSTGYIDIPSSNHPLGNVTITYSCWIKPITDPNVNWRAIIDAGSLGDFRRSALMAEAPNSYLVSYTVDGGQYVEFSYALIPDQWAHLVFTKQVDTASFYVNGALVGTFLFDSDQDVISTGIRIGGPGSGNEYYHGLIDDIRIYDRALDIDEANVLYHEGAWDAPSINSTAQNGTISPSGDTTIDFGGTQKYTFIANVGYSFDSLLVDGVDVPESTSSYTFSNVTANHTIRAVFDISAIIPGEHQPDSNTVLLLHLNEASGSIVSDASGNGNDGITSGTTIVDGKFGKGRRFSESTDTLSVSRQNLKLPVFTVEAWIYLDSLPLVDYFIVSNLHSGVDKGFFLAINGDKAHLTVGAGVGQDHHLFSNTSFVPYQWYHVAGTFDGAMMKLFVNGLEDASTVWTSIAYEAETTYPLLIGSHNLNPWDPPNQYFTGIIDEVRISNEAREPWEFNIPRTDGLIAYYPFNGNANDSMGSGLNGTVYGPILCADRFANDSAAYLFDGVDDYIGIEPIVSSDTFSVSLWIRAEENSEVAFYYQGSREFAVGFLYPNILNFGVKLEDGWHKVIQDSGDVITYFHEWVHVVATYDRGEKLRLYVNNQLVASSPDVPSLNYWQPPTPPPSSFGAVYGSINHYKGVLDDVRFYGRRLIENEIDSLFHEGGWPLSPAITQGFITTQVLDADDSYAIIPTATIQVLTSGDSLLGTMQYHPPGDPYDGYYRFVVPDISKNYLVRCLSPDSVYSRTVNGPDSTFIHNNTYFVVSSDFLASWSFNGVDKEAYPRQFIRQNSGGALVPSKRIIARAGPNGTILPSDTVAVDSGGNRSFAFTPQTGYHVDSVFVDGVNVPDSTTSFTFKNVTADHTIHVVFRINQYTITATSGSNGTISPLGSISVNYNANQQYTVTPNTGYHTDSVFVDGVNVPDSTTSFTFKNVTADHTIHVVFRSATIQDGLVAYYPFNGNANDESGNGNNGIVYQATLCSDRFLVGDKAYQFDGFNDYINLGVLSGLNEQKSVTFSTWVNASPGSGYPRVIGKEQDGNSSNGLDLQIEPSGKIAFNLRSGGIGGAAVTHVSIQLASWVHLVAVFNGGENPDSNRIKIYVNGQLESCDYITPIPFFTSGNEFQCWIGGIYANPYGAPWNGSIDDIRIYNRALGGAEIDSLYREGGWPPPQNLIIAGAGPHGSITPRDSVWVDLGETQAFTFTPDTGYHVDSVLVDGSKVDSTTSYTFAAVTSDHVIRVVFARNPEYSVSYRTFTPVELAQKNAVKKKPIGYTFSIKVLNSGAQSATGLELNFGGNTSTFVEIDSLTRFGSKTTSNQKAWSFSDGLVGAGDSVLVYGKSYQNRPAKIVNWRWISSGTNGSYQRGFIPSIQQSFYPAPNYATVRDQLFSSGAFGIQGMLIGVDRSDSARKYGWVRIRTSKNMQLSLSDRTGDHLGQPRCFDFTREHKTLQPRQHNNTLFANLVALKFGIKASAVGTTQNGLGELIYDDGGSNSLNGLMLKEIAAKCDTLLMGRYVSGLHQCENQSIFDNMNATIARIDSAFDGPIDTLSFASTLVIRGVRTLDDVAFLHPNPAEVPEIIVPEPGFVSAEADAQFKLYQNYPNAFNPTTTIQFELPDYAIVSLKIYDVLGREIAVLLDRQEMSDGIQEVNFDAGSLATGVYLYRLVVDGTSDEGEGVPAHFTDVKKMLLVK